MNEAAQSISRFISLLDSQRSVAATHRLLGSHKLVYESYATFVKRWKGAEAWARSLVGIHAEALAEISEMVGLEDDYVSEAVLELKKLWGEYQRPLPFHGGTLFDTSPYRSGS